MIAGQHFIYEMRDRAAILNSVATQVPIHGVYSGSVDLNEAGDDFIVKLDIGHKQLELELIWADFDNPDGIGPSYFTIDKGTHPNFWSHFYSRLVINVARGVGHRKNGTIEVIMPRPADDPDFYNAVQSTAGLEVTFESSFVIIFRWEYDEMFDPVLGIATPGKPHTLVRFKDETE